MFQPSEYYIYEPDTWKAQAFNPLTSIAEKTTKRHETACMAYLDGKVVAYRAHNRFIRLELVPAWREREV